MFRQMPVLLLVMILLVSLVQGMLPLPVKSALYALSLSLKSVIVFALPFVIFSLLFKSISQLAGRASKMVILLLGAICLSNFISTLMSYSVGHFTYRMDLCANFPDESLCLSPAWELTLPKWIANDHAMFAGLLSGLFLGTWQPEIAKTTSLFLEKLVGYFLKILLYIIPFFLLGFIVKMNHDQVMGYIVKDYGLIFSVIAGSVFAYIFLIYLAASNFKKTLSLSRLKNMLPAAVAGFGSMSSAAAMPLTILATEKNAKHPDIARSVIPATVNVHLIGDCFAIPIFAFAVLKTFGMQEPDIASYLLFSAYFVLAKFSVAAVPGGGILVMIPILESTLGFNSSMISLITALYILFDPVITCANVMGNGGFALLFDKLFGRRLKSQ